MTNRKRTVISLSAAAVLACAAGGAGLAVSGSHGHPAAAASATLTAASCHGPAGAAYVADPGYQAFSAVNTANCAIVQTYNVDDLQVPGDTGDYNYTGSDPGIAMSGSTLWFAVAATDNVAAIDTTTLDPSNYSPAETLIPVGYMPEALAATPDGSQVWVVDSGPQTSTSPLWGISVITTSTDTVARHFNLVGDPTDVAFSPNGQDAYVTTSNGLYIYNVASQKQVGFIARARLAEVGGGGAGRIRVYVTETIRRQAGHDQHRHEPGRADHACRAGAVAGRRVGGRLDGLRSQPRLEFGQRRQRRYRARREHVHGEWSSRRAGSDA